MYLLAELYDISVSLLFALLVIAFAPAERSGDEDPWLCAPAANPARYLMGQLRPAWAGWRVLIIINYACWWLTGLALVLGLTAGPARAINIGLALAALSFGGAYAYWRRRWLRNLFRLAVGLSLAHIWYVAPLDLLKYQATGPLARLQLLANVILFAGFLINICTTTNGLSEPTRRRWPRLWPIADGLLLGGALLVLPFGMLRLLTLPFNGGIT